MEHFLGNLDPAKGSEQAGERPVLVISIEEVNQVLPIVTVVSLTSLKPGRKVYPIEVLLNSSDTGLPKDSVVMTHQIRAIAKERLGNQCGSIESKVIRQKIKAAIRLYLDCND